MELFDQGIASTTAWMYRAEILLDEMDKQKPQHREETKKVLHLSPSKPLVFSFKKWDF